MRQPAQTELFKKYISSSDKTNMKEARNRVAVNTGVVMTRTHLEEQMVTLKNMRKTSYYPLMSQVFQLAHTTDMVVPFCFDEGLIQSVMPFIQFKTNGHLTSVRPAIRTYINLYKIGHWNADKTKFNISPLDLYSALETGVIMYNLQKKGADILIDDNIVLETSARIYAKLLVKAIERSKRSISSEVDQDLALYLSAKFFLMYIIGKQDSEYTRDIAYKSVRYKTPLMTLRQIEESTEDMDYDSLSGFLQFFGNALDIGEIKLRDLVVDWIKMYGANTILMIEYFPYFLHFIFAALKGSQSISRLYHRRKEIEKDGMRLYQAVTKHM
jgi:hypothetical protein